MTTEDLAFANRSAELTSRGKAECKKLAIVLPAEYGINVYDARAAVSKFVRTQQTARLLGFRKDMTLPYSELDEVDHGMELGTLRAMLRQNQIPPIALKAAKATLRQAPSEDVWVSHGLLIAGLCAVLGTVDQYERPVSRQCEVRRLTF
jgi:hypothetical protein